MKCIVFYNSKNEENLKILEKLSRLLENNSISVKKICVLEKCSNIEKADFAISVGGDGTVLWASHYIVDMDIPLMAVKSGGLGFLSSVEVAELEDFIKKYLDGKYTILERSMLKISYKDKVYKALNDCVVKSSGFRMFYADVYYSDEFISSYFSDGLIISTPTGSTAYNLSAFGSIVHPKAEVVIINPISSHTLTHRSLILPQKCKLRVFVRKKDLYKDENIFISFDGQINIPLEDSIEISVYDKKLKHIVSQNYSYFDILRKKLSWGER